MKKTAAQKLAALNSADSGAPLVQQLHDALNFAVDKYGAALEGAIPVPGTVQAPPILQPDVDENTADERHDREVLGDKAIAKIVSLLQGVIADVPDAAPVAPPAPGTAPAADGTAPA